MKRITVTRSALLTSGLILAALASQAFAQAPATTPAPAAAAVAPASKPDELPSVGGIPPQTIDEKQQFATIKLDSYVTDQNFKPETMVWTVTGNKDLQVVISNRVATVKIPSKYWNGTEAITFIAKNPKGGQGAETVNFVVNPVNDPPEVTKKIADQNIDEGKTFSPIKLDDYVVDHHNPINQLKWEASVDAIAAKEKPIQGGDITVTIDANRIATVVIPDTNWFGAAKVTFTVTNGAGLSAKTAPVTVNVKHINRPPILQKIPDQAIDEGHEFEVINLTSYVSDVDDDVNTMKWTVTGGNKLKAIVDKHNILSIKAPEDKQFNCNTEVFTVNVQDAHGGQTSTKVSFTVRAINDPPELKQIPAQTIDEGKKFATIDLKQYASDPDNRFDELKWTITGNKNLLVNLVGSKLDIAPKDTLWSGEETITFSVTDPGNLKAETQTTFTVHHVDHVPIMKTIPDQTIDEKGKFAPIKLDDFVSDADNKLTELQWEFTVKTTKKTLYGDYGDLVVSMDQNRVAVVSIPDKFYNGAATVTFTVTDPEGAKATKTANFTVKPVNDPPVIAKIPDQTIDEGNALESINLDQMVTDVDHPVASLKWAITGNKGLLVNIDKNRVVSLKVPGQYWNGEEILTLTATDPLGGIASTKVKIHVNAINYPPVMKEIPTQTVLEKHAFKPINLDEYVSDPDNTNSQIKMSVTGGKMIKVTLEGHLVKLAPIDSEWGGSEELTFTAQDPGGLKAERTVTYTVTAVNDSPRFVKQIADQTISEGKQFAAIKLDDYVFDPDNKKDELTWETSIAKPKGVKGQPELSVQIDAARVARIIIPDTLWSGTEIVTFSVSDPGGLKAKAAVTFSVTYVNHTPYFSQKIPDQTIDEHAKFEPINLDDFVVDADRDDTKDKLKWTIEGGNQLTASIDKKRSLLIRIPNDQWNGVETFKLTVTDPKGAAASAPVKFTVKPINDPPVLKEIPSQAIDEGKNFKPFDLKQLVSDPDNTFEQLKWTITGNKALKIANVVGVITVSTPDSLWSGEETINFAVNDGLTTVERQATFTVRHVNHVPYFTSKIADQTIDEGKKFATIDLKKVLVDADNKFEEHTWTTESVPVGGKKGATGALQVNIENGIASIAIPDSLWHGAETVTFVATDAEGAKATASATFTVKFVNHAPTINMIPDQTIDEKTSFQPLNLGEIINDVDNAKNDLKVSVSGNKDLKVTVDKNLTATITQPNKYWNGSEKLTFTVTDPLGAKASQTVPFTIRSINDPPVIAGLKGQAIDAGKEITPITLDAIVTDPDDAKEKLVWSVTGNKGLKVTISPSRVVTIKTPDTLWHGTEVLTFKVTDPQKAADSAQATFEVRAVNHAPVLKQLRDQGIDEGRKFVSINLKDYASDVDNKFEELAWTAKIEPVSGVSAQAKAAPAKKGKKSAEVEEKPAAAAPDLAVDFQNGVATISVPDSLWNGERKITLTAQDPGGLKASSSAIFTVRRINHAPQISKDLQSKTFTIPEKTVFAPINLAQLIGDVDNSFSTLKIEVTGQRELVVNVDKEKVLNVKPPKLKWHGKEILTISATDPEGAKTETKVTFEVTPVNDPPKIGKFASQTIKEHQAFKAVNLDSTATDPDNKASELIWTVSGNKDLKAEIAKDRTLKVTIPNDQWNGSETLKLTVKDPGGLSDTASAVFTATPINDPPVLADIPSQSIKEHEAFKVINLDDYANDPDNKKSELTFTATIVPTPSAAKPAAGVIAPAGELKFNIAPDHKATIVIPNDQWNGERLVTITVADPGGLKASKTFTLKVAPVNDPPVLQKLADQTIDEHAQFAPIDLFALVSDPDNTKESLVWSFNGARDLKPSIEKGKLSVAIPNKYWYGSEKITVTAADLGGLKSTQTATFTVRQVNNPPVLGDIKGQTVDEGKPFEMLDVSKLASDPDNKNSELTWTHSEKTLKVEFNPAKQLFRISAADPYWFGSDTVSFTVTDPAKASDTKKVVFTVRHVNQAPTLSKINDVSIKQHEVFAAIDLNKFVKDPDNKLEELKFSLDDAQPSVVAPAKGAKGKKAQAQGSSVKHQLLFNIDGKNTLHIASPAEKWSGSETVKINAFDPDGAKGSVDVKFTVVAVNDAPVIVGKIEDQTIDEGKAFTPVKLDPLAKDPDNKNSELTWTAEGNHSLDVMINNFHEAIIKPKRPDFFGQERITFIVKDPGGLKADISAVFTVKHVVKPPVLAKIADQTVNEDDAFKPILMDQVASSKDFSKNQLKWEVTGNRELEIDIDRTKGQINVKPPRQYWRGKPEVLTIKVRDPEGGEASQNVTYTSLPVNHAPAASPHSYATRQGEELRVGKDDGLLSGATDVDDGDKASDATVVDRPVNGVLNVAADGSFTYSPKSGFSGVDEFSYKVRDKQNAWSKPERVEINVQFKMEDLRGSAPAAKKDDKKKK